MRKIAVVTGTRAEYGLLYWIIKEIHEAPELELQLIVTGMHLSPEFGLTVQEIEKDGVPIAERVEMLLSSDTDTAITTSMGLGIIGFAKAYEKLRPDILLVLGDRFEILSAVVAAVPFRIPVAHIHGGESTEGAIDELFRHAITKMSHIHFPATQVYANRIRQMGESPGNVFCFGAPGIDNIYKLDLISKKELLNILEIPQDKKIGLVTYHPVTLEKNSAESQISELLEAMDSIDEFFWVITMPNADADSRVIIKSLDNYVQDNPGKAKLFSSLGKLRYLSLLKHAALMVGNSSSGIIEAPSFELPVVNIGCRQQGRIRAENVIDVLVGKKSNIVNAINKAISYEFKESLAKLINPYGEGDASCKIVEILKTVKVAGMIKKQFCDLPGEKAR